MSIGIRGSSATLKIWMPLYVVVNFFTAQGHGVLEMPSGTGKTISLLSLIVAYQKVSFDVHVNYYFLKLC